MSFHDFLFADRFDLCDLWIAVSLGAVIGMLILSLVVLHKTK